MKRVSLGIESLENFIKRRKLKKARVSVLCHPSSVTPQYEHIADILDRQTKLVSLFGPQHGIFGETQDNMIEWQDGEDEKGRPLYSLYGERRAPIPQQLKDTDYVFIDLFDIGTRFYTFIYSMSYMLKLCLKLKIPVVICDRPNPLGGQQVSGNILDPKFKSFVGLHELCVQHGMTMGELAKMFAYEFTGSESKELLHILKVKNLKRSDRFDNLKLPWTLPSPNMPNFQAARMFPGMCLLEATSLSEGRGTTRPFELIGAPFIDWAQVSSLYIKEAIGLGLSPVQFHRQGFIPTFHKHSGEVCRGVIQIPPSKFQALEHGVLVLWLLRKLYGDKWSWKQPPYEYEYDKWPIDILGGGTEIREFIDEQRNLKTLFNRWKEDEKRFKKIRKQFLIYE